jgi:hypothetical protein
MNYHRFLLALQTISVHEVYHQKMLSIVEPIIKKAKKQTGREGMTIWAVITSTGSVQVFYL